MDNRVLVLLSTYNGEKYVIEQLDSLEKQTVPVFILIRDDGSTDKTVEIVKNYSKNHNNIKLIEGENVGYVESFNKLLLDDEVNRYSYIAFCDQDDVWMEEKLSVALSNIKEVDDGRSPVMYCSNLMLVNEHLSNVGYMYKKELRWNKYTALVQNIATGCTMVFNAAATDLYVKSICHSMVSHDYTMFLICAYFGKVYYDSTPHILYRQHSENVLGGKSKSFGKGIVDICTDFFKPKDEKRIEWFKNFISIYDDNFVDADKNIIDKIVNYKNSVIDRISIALSKKYVGYDLKTTLGFKTRTLIGRMY